MDVKMEDDFSFHTWGNLRFWLFKVNQIHGGVESQKFRALIRVMTGHENMTCEWYLHNNMKSHLFQDFGSFKQVQFLINLQSNGPTKNAKRIFCPLLSLPKCTESSPLFATPWIQWLLYSCSSPKSIDEKKGFTHSPISSRIKCRNSHHFPEKSGSHQFTSFAGIFPSPPPTKQEKTS